jgi:hypothetical protein
MLKDLQESGMSIIKPYFALAVASTIMLKITIPIIRFFAYFLVGIFLAFPISAMCGAIAIFLSYLPLIWQILWRTGLGLMMLTAIALFLEGLNNGTKRNP